MRCAPVQAAASTVGAVFLLIGLLGLAPIAMTHLDQLTVAGHHSGAALLGVFEVSKVQNRVQLGFGLAGLLLARRFRSQRDYLMIGGAAYLVFACMGCSSAPAAP